MPFVADVRMLSAFKFRPDFEIDPAYGHKFYNAEEEYKRMGVPNRDWQAVDLNEQFLVCIDESFMPVSVCITL